MPDRTMYTIFVNHQQNSPIFPDHIYSLTHQISGNSIEY